MWLSEGPPARGRVCLGGTSLASGAPPGRGTLGGGVGSGFLWACWAPGGPPWSPAIGCGSGTRHRIPAACPCVAGTPGGLLPGGDQSLHVPRGPALTLGGRGGRCAEAWFWSQGPWAVGRWPRAEHRPGFGGRPQAFSLSPENAQLMRTHEPAAEVYGLGVPASRGRGRGDRGPGRHTEPESCGHRLPGPGTRPLSSGRPWHFVACPLWAAAPR